MEREVKKYTVDVTKTDGMKSKYFVLALSAGAAEETTLREVYAAKYALAVDGWPEGVQGPDLYSRGVGLVAVSGLAVLEELKP